MSEQSLPDAVTETAKAVSDWQVRTAKMESQARDLDAVVAKSIKIIEDQALQALLGSSDAKFKIATARNAKAEAESELAVIGIALPAAKLQLSEAEAAAQSARGALARHHAEREMRRRIEIAARVDVAIAALAAALHEFDDSGTDIMNHDVLPHNMFGSSAISRSAEIAGHRRVRSALPKSFLRYYPDASHESMPATTLEASEIQMWSLPEEPAAKAA
jgi:hypothetical protein